MKLADAQALTFDCYGTLIDWESGILGSLKPWIHRHGLLIEDDRLLEEFGQAESRIERDNPRVAYSEILRHVHHSMARAFGLSEDIDEAASFAGSVGDWPPFPDTIATLRELKKRFRLVIVSNTDHACFARTREKLGVDFDAVVIAEDVGAYKPNPLIFQRALDVIGNMGIPNDRIVHVAQSLYHDHVPAKALGLTTVWVDRYRGQRGLGATVRPECQVQPDHTITSLRELADLMRV